jgi:hypothetical protein
MEVTAFRTATWQITGKPLNSKTTKNFLPFWAFPVADKLTSVPFFPNLKILKPYDK